MDDDAYEHLCILTLLSSLGPLRLMLADTSLPRGLDATLASVGPLSEGFERFVAAPLYLVGYVRWDARSDRPHSSFRQSFPAAFQVAPVPSTTPVSAAVAKKRPRPDAGQWASSASTTQIIREDTGNFAHPRNCGKCSPRKSLRNKETAESVTCRLPTARTSSPTTSSPRVWERHGAMTTQTTFRRRTGSATSSRARSACP